METKIVGTHLVATPGTCGGKPRIRGRRITVQNIAIWHNHMALSPEEIASDYDLSLAEVHAALAHYFEHQVEMDEEIGRGEAFVRELAKKTPSRLLSKLQELPGGKS